MRKAIAFEAFLDKPGVLASSARVAGLDSIVLRGTFRTGRRN
jgi:hypothetical protein